MRLGKPSRKLLALTLTMAVGYATAAILSSSLGRHAALVGAAVAAVLWLPIDFVVDALENAIRQKSEK